MVAARTARGAARRSRVLGADMAIDDIRGIPPRQDPTSAATAVPDAAGVPFGQALRFWLKLGFISFGGPAGQIAIMHTELVERRRWISEQRFLHALNYCMLLPGPEAQQLATYIGWLMHRTAGGIAAGLLFVLPSLVLLILLSWLYLTMGQHPAVAGNVADSLDFDPPPLREEEIEGGKHGLRELLVEAPLVLGVFPGHPPERSLPDVEDLVGPDDFGSDPARPARVAGGHGTTLTPAPGRGGWTNLAGPGRPEAKSRAAPSVLKANR